MAKIPTAKDFLSDPKYGEQKGFFRDIMLGIAEEERAQKPPKKKSINSEDSGNIFDAIFGGSEEGE
jgi:hypothetical protein